MALFGPLFKRDGLEVTATGDVDSYLKNELGWTLKEQQERSLGMAIQKPESFLDQRGREIDKIFKGQVGPAYVKAMTDLGPLGLPEETLKTLAMRRADFAYKEALEVEELRHPGYSRALGAQEAVRDQIENRYTKDDRRAIKQKAIAKYKSQRKARKAAKKTA